jgi:predicted DNA-binding ribbon-helix-helix protein
MAEDSTAVYHFFSRQKREIRTRRVMLLLKPSYYKHLNEMARKNKLSMNAMIEKMMLFYDNNHFEEGTDEKCA